MRINLMLIVLLTIVISGCDRAGRGSHVAEPEPVGGPTLMRRLTESQYRATVADLFGADVPVVARPGRAPRREGSNAVGTGWWAVCGHTRRPACPTALPARCYRVPGAA